MKTGRADWDAMIKVAGIPSDEPVFLLRGQNKSAPATVRFWALTEEAAGTPVAIIELALQQADRMIGWPVKTDVGDDHLSDNQRKDLKYRHSRRRWRAAIEDTDAILGGLLQQLLGEIDKVAVTEDSVNLKTLAHKIRQIEARTLFGHSLYANTLSSTPEAAE